MTSETHNKGKLQTIVVDLTPVLPGGDNGGAKVFVLELLRQLGDLARETQFILLTQAAAHQELAALDGPNIRRVMVFDRGKSSPSHSITTRIFTRLLRHLPARPRRVATRAGYRLMKRFKKRGAGMLLRDLSADLLFCPFTAPTYFEPGIPTVSVIYDLQYKTYPEFFTSEDLVIRDQSFIDAARKATALVAISDYSRQAAIAAGQLEPNRITTIHLHLSQHRLQTSPFDDAILNRLGLREKPFLIYPANFWKHKNHEMLITAYGLACGRVDFCLVCTGAPSTRQQFMKLAAKALGLSERVLFPGYISHAELLALMTNCSGLVFPSLYEGFGLPVIEAMALGVPVACSNVTSLPEVAGEAAILFDPRKPEEIASAMIELIQNDARRAKLIEAGKVRAAGFSDSRQLAKQYWAIFERAVDRQTQSDILLGVTPDGWVGSVLKVLISSAANPRRLDLDFLLPSWVPIAKLTLHFTINGKSSGSKKINRAERTSLSIALPQEGGYCEVEFSTTFVPALTGLGDDQRELSAMLLSCQITGDSAPVVLFPDQMLS